MEGTYQSVPVDQARQIGESFNKDCVVILTYDADHERTHVTTWGRSPEDKAAAARVGELCAQQIGCEMETQTVHQDYRREGEAAQAVDRLVQAGRSAVHLIDSLLAVRNGPTDDLLIEIRRALVHAMATA